MPGCRSQDFVPFCQILFRAIEPFELSFFPADEIGQRPKGFALIGRCDKDREPAGQPHQKQRSSDPTDAQTDHQERETL